jgi:hypothetical protein
VIDKTTETGTRVLNVTLDDAACRREFMWMSYFRAGLVWALWLGQDVDLLTLAKYPADDAADEARGGGDFGPPEKAYFTAVRPHPGPEWAHGGCRRDRRGEAKEDEVTAGRLGSAAVP